MSGIGKKFWHPEDDGNPIAIDCERGIRVIWIVFPINPARWQGPIGIPLGFEDSLFHGKILESHCGL